MTGTELTAEEALLIELCRLRFQACDEDDVKHFAGQVSDWDYFVKKANDHGVAALIWRNLENLKLHYILPEKCRSFLKNAFILSMSHNAARLKHIRDLFAEIDYKTVLLKGAALELMVYGNTGLRQMNDVDVLLTRDDCIAVYKHLKKKGYKNIPLKSALYNNIIGYYGKHLPTLVKNGLSLELHHNLFGSSGNDLTSIFYQNAIEYNLDNVKVYLPEPSVFFLYLVRHLNSHELNNESQLRLYTDLALLIEISMSDTFVVNLLSYAKNTGLERELASKLYILKIFWKLAFPRELEVFIFRNDVENTIYKFIYFLRNPRNNPALKNGTSYRQIIKSIPGFHRKVIYIAGDLFPSTDFMKKRYNHNRVWKILFYYPHRWGKVIWMVGRDEKDGHD